MLTKRVTGILEEQLVSLAEKRNCFFSAKAFHVAFLMERNELVIALNPSLRQSMKADAMSILDDFVSELQGKVEPLEISSDSEHTSQDSWALKYECQPQDVCKAIEQAFPDRGRVLGGGV